MMRSSSALEEAANPPQDWRQVDALGVAYPRAHKVGAEISDAHDRPLVGQEVRPARVAEAGAFSSLPSARFSGLDEHLTQTVIRVNPKGGQDSSAPPCCTPPLYKRGVLHASPKPTI
jgi:hypothetical protein